MENKLLVKCANGHDAHQICNRPKCPHPAPICKDESCEHFSKHSECMMIIDVEKLVSKLINQGSKHKAADEEIIKYYERMIKLLEAEKQQFMKLINEPGMRLKGVEGKLYWLLKEGPGSDIMPMTVFNVIEGLTDKGNDEMEKYRKEAAELGRRVAQEVEKSVGKIRKLWGNVDAISKISIIKGIAEDRKEKKKTIEKSLFVLDVNVHSKDTNLDNLASKIFAEVKKNGLVWSKDYKILPVANTGKKLQVSCVVEDEKISAENIFEIFEVIEGWKEVEYVDIITIEKI